MTSAIIWIGEVMEQLLKIAAKDPHRRESSGQATKVVRGRRLSYADAIARMDMKLSSGDYVLLPRVWRGRLLGYPYPPMHGYPWEKVLV